MNPLRDGGGGKEDTLTTRGDGPSIYRADAPYNNTYHPLRGGKGDVHGCYISIMCCFCRIVISEMRWY